MSANNRSIGGDVSVGRNANVGGKAVIQGSVIINHSLRVKGNLDAPNIMGANKGVFATENTLNAAYPNPHNGWVAGVLGDGVIDMYLGSGGAWVQQPGRTIEFAIDLDYYDNELEQLQADIVGMASTHFDGINSNAISPSAGSSEVVAASVVYSSTLHLFVAVDSSNNLYLNWDEGSRYNNYVEGNPVSIVDKLFVNDNNGLLYYRGTNNHLTAVVVDFSSIDSRLNTIEGNVTAAGNAATAAGAVAEMARSKPSGYFKGFVEGIEEVFDEKYPSAISDNLLRNYIVFDKDRKQFLCRALDDSAYYTKWNEEGEKAYMTQANGRPLPNKLYVDSDGKVYFCDTAGNLKAIYIDFSSLQNQIDGLSNTIDGVSTVANRADRAASAAGALALIMAASHFDGITNDAIDPQEGDSTVTASKIVYSSELKIFLAIDSNDDYYQEWNGADRYNTYNEGRATGIVDKLFICDDDTQMLYYRGPANKLLDVRVNLSSIRQQLETMAANITTGDTANRNLIAPRLFVNVMKLMNRSTVYSTMAAMLEAVAGRNDHALYQIPGVVLTFQTAEGWQTMQWHGTTATGDDEDWSDTESWKKIGGAASVGNCYNVTVDAPLAANEFYDLDGAIDVAWSRGYKSVGMQITFAITATSWKTYQYVGANSSEANFKNVSNWIDLAGMSAGAETLINVDALCGACTQAQYYNLSYAIAAINALSQNNGITYAKPGLFITYQTGADTWETKQFVGNVADFGEAELWNDFGGGGGGNVETSDEPEDGGEDAFSTGGAYKYIPANLQVDTETEGVVKIKMVNAAGDEVGDEQQFPVGTGGGGGGTGTIVTLNYQHSPMYGNVGSDFIIRAAIRSVTTQGQTEQDNTIASIAIIDRDTNTTLDVLNVNQASSATSSDYTFSIDVTQYFTTAGVRRLRLVATDDTGNTGSRNINVTAVDVTVTSVQTLQHTTATALTVGGASRSIPLYKFANNASDQGITAITEIYLDGQWQELGREVVQNTYSHNITIDPNNCLGEVLTHGVYQLRVHGIDVASGVVGNYLYTGIFVVDATSTEPLVVTSWYANGVNASVKLYETLKVNYAVYDPTTNAPTAIVFLDNTMITTQTAHRSSAYSFTHQVTGVASDGTVTQTVRVYSGLSAGPDADFLVYGSVIDAVIKAGAIYAFDFANRSNQETDHTIASGGYSITPVGVNWSTTGFVPATPGGEMAFRVAEDVTATLNHQPFKPSSIESNGLGIQFAFQSKNLVDDDAVLMQCFNEGVGAGFYVTGKAVGIYCATGLSNHAEERAYKQGERVTVAVVVEPAVEGLGQTRQGTTYYFIKLYLNGEEVAVIGYVSGQSNLLQEQPITFDGTQGDLYLYYILAWNDYFQFDQAFQNYLVKLTDTESMVREYDFENIMASQQVTELGITTTKLRPQATALEAQGMAYIIECPYGNSDIEALDTTVSTKTNMYVNLYYVDPSRPWTNFIAEDVRRRNQGTTSAQRPVKNPRYYLAQKNGSTYVKATKTGGTTIQPMYTRQQVIDMGYAGELWDHAAALFAINKVQIHDDSIPVDIITVKVDYSDSSNANDCGVCDMMNATFKALGGQYLTPAQRAFDGTWKKGTIELSGLTMNHSTANFPVAMYRSKESTGASPYFHAKGNWKEDKKEQTALGFIDTPGYTKGCLNYGDFVEFYGKSAAMLNAEAGLEEGDTGYHTTDETLTEAKARFLATSGLDTTATYILTQYCGSSYKVMKYVEGQWVEQTGSMVQNANGKWTVTGSVLNPTDGFELLNYQGMDWFKGVASVSDLMAPSQSYSKWVQALIDDGSISVESVPAWTYYFESLVDNDDLAIAFALGKKVPYNLLRWMMFCNSCDYDIDGNTALARWKAGLWRFACPQSVMAYSVFTDYCAAVDQRAKNMQPMWFIEDGCKVVNGVYYNADNETYEAATGMMPMRMYLNKVYDCDTCNGKDNDGGQTIDAEVDPNKMPDVQTGYTNPYAGYNSVLFRNLYLQPSVYIDANNTELAMKTVASAMRSCTATVDGMTIHPFSPEGAQYFFVTSRIKRWPKKVSSYDGERKYIDFTSTTANNIYFYALQGLGLTSLPAFIERRWRIRDGFYGTGDFFSGVLSGRVNSANDATITIKAAKTGYFGIGNDSSGSLSKSVYLEAGESYTFPADSFSHEEGALLYIYQADRMSEIDLSQISLSSNFDFSVMTLAEKIILGSENKVNMTIGAYTPLTNVNLGELPFLKLIDIRGTLITNLVCSGCPRLLTLKATGSQLTRADVADGAKITRMELPSTYQYLKLRYLPDMEASGIVLANAASITTLIVEQCAKIDPVSMLRTIAGTSGSALSVVRVQGISTTYDGSDLAVWATKNWSGLDATLTAQEAPALGGVYMLSHYTAEEDLTAWQTAFPELTIHQAQYTMVVQDDTVQDPVNVKNLDNNTGYGTGDAYTPSGHILKLMQRVPVTGKLNPTTGNIEVRRMSLTDYKKLADGSSFDYSDNLGTSNDAFMLERHCWKKGINDFKNQLKYTAVSSLDSRPMSTASVVRRAVLNTLDVQLNTAVMVGAITVNESTMESSGVLATTANVNTYTFDVEGMKQVRWPGMNNATIGVCFLDAEGTIISKYNMAVAHADFDFNETTGDYIFINVPDGAKTFVFTSRNTNGACEVIAVDSLEVEAIEPDWVEVNPFLGAIYQASIDSTIQIRSLSGRSVRVGTGTSTTSTEWTYDTDGNPTNTPLNAMNYTGKDFQNLSRRRGAGYQLFDYEMSSHVALLYFLKTGNRDAQKDCGYGQSAGGSTGYTDSLGVSDSVYTGSSAGNKCMGYESFFGCTWEFMDNVAVNVRSWKQAYKDKMVGQTNDPVDAVWHIYDPVSDTERTVQGYTSSGQAIVRTKHGRHCDMIASKTASDSTWAKWYCDGAYYTASTCRVVGRSSSNSVAGGGLVYAYASLASSVSYSIYGSRLAFRPPQGKTIVFLDDAE